MAIVSPMDTRFLSKSFVAKCLSFALLIISFLVLVSTLICTLALDVFITNNLCSPYFSDNRASRILKIIESIFEIFTTISLFVMSVIMIRKLQLQQKTISKSQININAVVVKLVLENTPCCLVWLVSCIVNLFLLPKVNEHEELTAWFTGTVSSLPSWISPVILLIYRKHAPEKATWAILSCCSLIFQNSHLLLCMKICKAEKTITS